MRNIYIDTTANPPKKVTLSSLLERGLPNDEDLWKSVGIFPIKLNIPEYNKLTETVKPTGEPYLDVTDTNRYVQDFVVVPVDYEEQLKKLNEKVELKKKEVLSSADSAVSSYMNNFSDIEKVTWNKQELEVENYVKYGADAETPILDMLASIRGINRIEMLNKAISKIESFKLLAPTVIGTQQHYEDVIKSIANDESKSIATRIDELEKLNFDFSTVVDLG